jgi:NAD(P)-dependent dehydrogenase (short-subunit alcohol dehydrogenase family)
MPVALVTGASRGIGRQLCGDLAAAGYDVALTARSSDEQRGKLSGTIEETAALVEKQGRRALAQALDVRDEEGIAKLVARCFDELGGCDLLVNNAALAPPRAALQDSTRRWRLAVDVNVNAPFYFIYYLVQRAPQGGRVINISSAASVSPSFGRASYTTTKRALEAMTESLAHDLRGRYALNCIRLEIPVWTEGFAETLPPGDYSDFEDPVIMSDAVLWIARQPLDWSGHVLTLADLRARGAVRPRTRIGDRG